MAGSPQRNRDVVTPIPSYYITPVWPKVEAFIASAVGHVDSGYRPEDILGRLITSDMQLWVVGDYQAAAVTQISLYPQFKTCHVVALGGAGLNEWFDELMDSIEGWAADMGCKYVEEYGRKAWEKVGAARGYEHVYTVMRKKVDGR